MPTFPISERSLSSASTFDQVDYANPVVEGSGNVEITANLSLRKTPLRPLLYGSHDQTSELI